MHDLYARVEAVPPMSSTRSNEFVVGTIDRVIRFGSFCLRPAQQLLLDLDFPVRIGARALDLLIALVERAGELVTKDDLTARVWPGLSVDEGNLRTQMALLRRALRDGEAGARYLITVPGRGYRFVAPVSTSETQEPGKQPTFPVKSAPGLPGRLTRLIGRADAVNDIAGRLGRRRFVTVTGPGGIGKTSVALAVAEQVATSYDDGVCVVDCAPLLDTQLVAGKLASTLGLTIAALDPTEGLVAFLRSRRMLILLDSCERIVEAAAVLAEFVLRGATGVDILATSREPLRAEGEGVYRLPPLEIPPASGELTASDVLSYPAVQLFVERAASSIDRFELRDADAPVAVDICRKLDGMPLAIELAAGRVDVFGMRGVAARLDDRVRLLTHGRRTALLRHRTLAATLDWSYDALSRPEQTVLRRLAIFASNFTLDAAQAVATDAAGALTDIADVVTTLVSKSLLNADLGTETGLYRLLDTTREYTRNKLVDNEEFDLTARRHADYIRLLLEGRTAGAQLVGAAHIDDIRVALDWAFSSSGDVEIGVALTAASLPLWTRLSLNEECRRGVERALLEGRKSNIRNDHREMQLLAALGAALIYTLGPGPEVDAAWADALKIAEKLDDADYQIRILWGMWSSDFNSGQFRTALTIGERFRDAAVNSGDGVAELVGERLLGVSKILSRRPYQCTTPHRVSAATLCPPPGSVAYRPLSIRPTCRGSNGTFSAALGAGFSGPGDGGGGRCGRGGDDHQSRHVARSDSGPGRVPGGTAVRRFRRCGAVHCAAYPPFGRTCPGYLAHLGAMLRCHAAHRARTHGGGLGGAPQGTRWAAPRRVLYALHGLPRDACGSSREGRRGISWPFDDRRGARPVGPRR